MHRLMFVVQNFSDGFIDNRTFEADATNNWCRSWLLRVSPADDDTEKKLEAISPKPILCFEHALLRSSSVLLSDP